MSATLPADESARLAALRSYHILDTPPELPYDEISELAAQICQCPVAVIGMIDETRDWKKSKYGLPADFTGLPREMSICSTTICGNDLMYIPDLTKDERFRQSPAVAGAPHLRMYCGMPLINAEGHALGTLCVVDFKGHELSFEQTESIRRLARQVVTQLELRRSVLDLDERMRELEQVRSAIAIERDKSDELLHNILPASVAGELKGRGRVEPRFYESTTILFADFEGFTRLTERTDPRSLVEQLDQFFSAFDEAAGRHRLEKLKTIGDAYMCAGGLPAVNRSHPVDACLVALAMQSYMEKMNRQRDRLHLPRWEVRIGIHTGPVVTGVVGQRKFAYDVWGDAVNVASRMEAAGAARRINVSDAVMNRVKDLFDFEDRGTIDVKNKGSLRMHYLSRIKSALSQDSEGHVPNAGFHRECERLFPGYSPAP